MSSIAFRAVILASLTSCAGVRAGDAPQPLLRYRVDSSAVVSNRWAGSPGPGVLLPAHVVPQKDCLVFSGKGSGMLLSRKTVAADIGLPREAMTVEAVVSVEQPQEWGGILGFVLDNGGLEKGWLLGYDREHFYIGLSTTGASDGDGAITYLKGRTPYEKGRLYHVAAVYDGKNLRLYVNGTLDVETTKQHGEVLYPDESVFVLGAYRDSDESHPHKGRIAEVALYPDALDDAAIAALAAEWREPLDKRPALVADTVRAAPTTDPWAGVRSPEDVVLPIHQRLTPAGKQVLLPKSRPQDIVASPDGSFVVTSGLLPELILIDPRSGAVLGRVPMPSGSNTRSEASADHILMKTSNSQLSFHGLAVSASGERLYLSNVYGDIKVFRADASSRLAPHFSIPLPEVKGLARRQEIPAGLALSAGGSRLYVALNLSDGVGEIEAETGRFVRRFEVGVAPFDVVLAKNKLYVSCWGGRRPDAASSTGPAGRGTRVRVDAIRRVASEGSVSVVDLEAGTVTREILTGMHASGMALSPDGKHLCVANANSDSVSVIDTATDEVIEQIRMDWQPVGFVGASPNALCFSEDGETLYVCNGTQNAVAVLRFRPPSSTLSGLIPVGWFPGAIALLPRSGELAVANIKGIGSGGHRQLEGAASYNSHEHCGSVTLVSEPGGRELRKMTEQTLANCRRDAMKQATLPPRPGQPPRAVPERAGEPSPIQHVVYIIKENRTYDQVLGDMEQGNGDPSLCIFGEKVTPNQHKIAREFVLLDNTHCCGVLSADGHQWSTSGFVNDYLEKQFAGFPRSYPDLCGADEHDALAYSPGGFLWDAALARGRTVRIFGESSGVNRAAWKDVGRKGSPSWRDHIENLEKKSGLIAYWMTPALESLRNHTCTNTVGWEPSIPDVVRAGRFLDELAGWEKNGEMPNLCLMTLPMDHTFGTGHGKPTPAATVADNDLAVGRIVEALSRSKFWASCAVFIIEDDPQNGWDHVSPYRTTAYLSSPYAKRGAVVSELYSQNSILRTIELILGLSPMNQLDAIATPMTACFNDAPDMAPFVSVPNQIPLTQMNGDPKKISDARARRDAVVSARLPLQKVDACPEDVLNEILWRAMKGTHIPYPGWAILPDAEDEDDERS